MKNLFIVGCPRSGTTLLQSLLTSHSDVISFTESHLFDILYCKKGYLRDGIYWKVRSRLKEFCSENDLVYDLPAHCFTYSQITSYFYSLYSRKSDKQITLEKTPSNLFHIENIRQLVPNARFIHIHKNPEENIASLWKVHTKYHEQWGKLSIEQCIKKYFRYHLESLNHQNALHNFHLQYDTLVSNTERTLERLCKWIDIEYQQDMLSHYKNQTQLMTEKEIWKTTITEPIYKRSSFDSLFNEKEKEYIKQYIEQEMNTILTT